MITQKGFGFSPAALLGKGAAGVFSSGAGQIFSTVIGSPFQVFGMIFADMFGSLFGKPVQCTDPFTGKVLTGKAPCMAAAWRANCSDPRTFDPKICGKELYDPRRVNCPPRSSNTAFSQYGVGIGSCVCDFGVSAAEALKIGCKINPIKKWWPIGAAAVGVILLSRS